MANKNNGLVIGNLLKFLNSISRTSAFSILIFTVIVISLLQSESIIAQQVSPFQTGHFMPAFTNVRDFTKMQPGLVLISYNYYGWTDTYVDRNGTEHDKFFLQEINPDLPDVSFSTNLKSISTVPSLFWGSKFTLLGGANYVAGISPSYFWADALIAARQGGGNIDTVYTRNEKVKLSGFADLFVLPFGLSWGWRHFDATFYYGFYAPTGRYETGADDNIGLGFWTHQFQGYGYWYPNKSQATAFMLGLTYELNTKIKGEDVNPGDRFSLEWGFSQYLSERLEISVFGGHNWQISDDTGSEVYWNASYHDRKSTIAFSLAVWAVKDRFYIAGKYMVDYGVRQRFRMQGLMINFIFVTNALDGKKSDKKQVN